MKMIAIFLGCLLVALGILFVLGCIVLAGLAGYESALTTGLSIARYGAIPIGLGAACLVCVRWLP